MGVANRTDKYHSKDSRKSVLPPQKCVLGSKIAILLKDTA